MLDMSNGVLRYALTAERGLAVAAYGLTDGGDWPSPQRPGRDFALTCDGERIDGLASGIAVSGLTQAAADTGSGRAVSTVHLKYEPKGLEIESHHIVYDGTAVVEKWITIRNAGAVPVTIGRIDSFHMPLPDDVRKAMYFESDWGAEFAPRFAALEHTFVVETRQGRSSKDRHPWLTLMRDNGELLTICPMWSGNWAIRCEKAADGTFAVNGGLHDWSFCKTLAPGEQMDSVRVVLALGRDHDLNTVSVPLARIGRAFWYPRNRTSLSLPVEWNPWWSYEDKLINEQVFADNAACAARLGVEVCTMDAGWFGPSDAEASWHDYRGDWTLVNGTRFPNGVLPLAEAAHRNGMKFGLWCEIEAVGRYAELAQRYPDFVARRSGESLGYVCFGNPAAREWAYQTLNRLIEAYKCDWIKLDFNLEPGAGCNCTDHGHGAGDGLFEHYIGYYGVLDGIRARHPEVLLENCASGGLRIDLGMMRHTHTTFLSDTDWPAHSLQVFWGASTFLAPNVALHWSYSDWLGEHPRQRFDPHDSALTPQRFDYYTRIAMLGGFGFSQKLPDLPDWLQERLAGHIRDYKTVVRRFVREADLFRLTAQPEREGRGDRWAAFQYCLPDGSAHLLFVFRLDGGAPERLIRLRELSSDKSYELEWLDERRSEKLQGAALQEGLSVALPEEESSALIIIKTL